MTTNSLVMGKEVERKIVKNISIIVTIIIKMIKKPVVEYFEVYQLTSKQILSIHHGQSLACTCAFLEDVCRDRHCTRHSGMICLYVCYKET